MYRFCPDIVRNTFRFGSDEIHFRISAGYFLICNVKTPTLIHFWYWTICTYNCTYGSVRPKNFHSECYPYQIRIRGVAEGHIWGRTHTGNLIKRIIHQRKAEDVRNKKIHDAKKSALCGLRSGHVSMATQNSH